MKLSLIQKPAIAAHASPYRLIDEHGQEITWANDFLDAQRIRQLSLRSVRAYAYDLLHFARWWLARNSQNLLDLEESTLLAYVRDQLAQQPPPTPQTINRRIAVLRGLVSLSRRTPIIRRVVPVSALLLHTLPARLRPSPSRSVSWAPAQRT